MDRQKRVYRPFELINNMPVTDRLSASDKHDIARTIRPLIEEDTGVRLKNIVDGVTPGKNDSRHDVYRMSAIGHDGKTSSMYVKRFREESKACYELTAIRTVHGLGLGGLKEVGRGVYNVSEHGSLLVTEEIPRLETMNIVDWRGYRRSWHGEEKGANAAQLSELMGDIARYVGKLHRNGITYHDLVLQNIGRTPDGEFVPFDLEFAKFYNPQDKYNFQYIADRQTDIACLSRSLAFSIGVKPEDRENFKQVVLEDILQPYAMTTGDVRMLGEVDDFVDQAIEHVEELKKEIAEQRANLARLLEAVESGEDNQP